jgi:hypothetical protein
MGLRRLDNVGRRSYAPGRRARTATARDDARRWELGVEVTVEHVHVHEGGQAVVCKVEAPGGGVTLHSKDQPRAKQIAHAPQPTVWSTDTARERVPVARDKVQPLRYLGGAALLRPLAYVIGCSDLALRSEETPPASGADPHYMGFVASCFKKLFKN